MIAKGVENLFRACLIAISILHVTATMETAESTVDQCVGLYGTTEVLFVNSVDKGVETGGKIPRKDERLQKLRW